MKVSSVRAPHLAKSWVVKIDGKSIIDHMANGSRFMHKGFKYLEADDGKDVVAKFATDAIMFFDEKHIADNPRVIMYIECPYEKTEMSLGQAYSLVESVIIFGDASVVWGLAISNSPSYAIDLIIELK